MSKKPATIRMSSLVTKNASAFARITVSACIALFLVLFATGCVISPRRLPGDVVPGTGGGGGGTPTPTPTPGTSQLGKIYVASPNNAILRFDGGLTASGNIQPATTITGAATNLAKPEYIFLDAAADRLYVTNQNNADILVWEAVSTKVGNAAPSRTITSVDLSIPTDLAVDTVHDLLYVADSIDILVFANASTLNGAATAARDIILTFAPSAIFLDTANDRLYAADPTNNAIAVFDSISTANNPTLPNRTLTGAQTGLSKPSGVQVDSAGRLIVSNLQSASVTIYDGAATVNANQAPSATISGTSTTLAVPHQIVVAGGQLYIADSGATSSAAAVDVYSSLSTATGNIAPNRRINGASTGLSTNAPNGIAVDTSR